MPFEKISKTITKNGKNMAVVLVKMIMGILLTPIGQEARVTPKKARYLKTS